MNAQRGGSVLRIIGLINGPATEFDGQYLVEYDPTTPSVSPDGIPMTAHLRTCPDLAGAHVFRVGSDAVDLWRSPSGRTRPDGERDRPLTAFTVSLESIVIAADGTRQFTEGTFLA